MIPPGLDLGSVIAAQGNSATRRLFRSGFRPQTSDPLRLGSLRAAWGPTAGAVTATLGTLSVVAPVHNEREVLPRVPPPDRGGARRASTSSSCSSTTARTTAPPSCSTALGGGRPARARDPPVAQLRPPGGAHGRPRPRARRRRRDDRRRPPGPARADPDDARALAPGRRRGLRRAHASATGETPAASSPPRAGSTACSRALAQIDLSPERRRLPAARPRARSTRCCSMRERNRFLRGMTVWVGFTQTAVPYERDAAPRRRDQVHAAAHAALLARRDLVVLARAAAVRDRARLRRLGDRVPRRSRSSMALQARRRVRSRVRDACCSPCCCSAASS